MTLETHDLGFSYGSKTVLDGINLAMERGDFVSILGPNGVGKTTLLKCLCRIHKLRDGSVLVDGQDINSMSLRDLSKHISYVPQQSFASMTTVYDTILLGRRPYIDWSVTDKDINMVWEIIELFHMEDYALKYTDEISGGELQKVNISRAIAQNARTIILDEPTNNLDMANQHVIMHLLSELVRRKQMCVIMTMHDINIALRYSNKFIFIKDGKVVASGGVEVVTPQNIENVYGVEVEIMEKDGYKIAIPKVQQSSFSDIDLNKLDTLFEENSGGAQPEI